MKILQSRFIQKFLYDRGYYCISDLQAGGHCGLCGIWCGDAVVVKDWSWTICDKCKNGDGETRIEKKPCFGCEFAQIGIPCGHCTHKEGYYRPLSDRYWFVNRPADCPKMSTK